MKKIISTGLCVKYNMLDIKKEDAATPSRLNQVKYSFQKHLLS